jgi:hypothetical protein
MLALRTMKGLEIIDKPKITRKVTRPVMYFEYVNIVSSNF